MDGIQATCQAELSGSHKSGGLSDMQLTACMTHQSHSCPACLHTFSGVNEIFTWKGVAWIHLGLMVSWPHPY